MPKRTDIHTVLIIGAGPIVIGQACEFDYSGAQACKALREEGYRVILVNSNPATIMTDPDLADAAERVAHPPCSGARAVGAATAGSSRGVGGTSRNAAHVTTPARRRQAATRLRVAKAERCPLGGKYATPRANWCASPCTV